MTENTSDETSSLTNNSNMSQRLATNTIRHPLEETPLEDTQTPPAPPPVVRLGSLNIGARTMERSRLFVNNISTTIEGIQPYIEQARLVIHHNNYFIFNYFLNAIKN